MSFNYLIVLFKNKEKKKIINKFKTYKRANLFYKEKLKESDDVIFQRNYENGVKCKYEIAIVGVGENNDELYIKDELGRQNKVELNKGGLYIRKISPFRVEEKVLDYQTSKKITLSQLIRRYLKKDGLKMVSKLNNKIVIQNDEEFNLFTLKTVFDADKFIDSISQYFREIGRGDCMFVKDISTTQRKDLYEILIKKGFPKRYLTRLSTTHPK
jgi:hypothetical protein